MEQAGWQKVTFNQHYAEVHLEERQSLDKKENCENIFQLMQSVTSIIQSGKSEGTGFFARVEGYGDCFLTASHILEERQITYISEYDQGLLVDKIGDIALFNLFSKKELSITPIEIAPHEENLYVGKSVYFVGFPFGKRTPLLHQGRISFVSGAKFSIDATVVPGHSGSPIFGFSEGDNKLYIFGMISSQSIDSLKNIEYLCSHKDENIQHIGSVFKANLSSGIGTGIDIREAIKAKDPKIAQNAFDKAEERKNDDGELPVMKGERVPKPMSDDQNFGTWVHYMKTNKRAQLNAITGRLDSKGKENSRGRANVTAQECKPLRIFYDFYNEIRASNQSNKEKILQKIQYSALPPKAKKYLEDQLWSHANSNRKGASSKSFDQSIKALGNRIKKAQKRGKPFDPMSEIEKIKERIKVSDCGESEKERFLQTLNLFIEENEPTS